VTDEELPFEYMMNRLRLHAGFSLDEFKAYTGLSEQAVLPTLLHAQEKQLMEFDGTLWSVSKLGHRYLNDLLEMFL
jgi:oxygen-independent coproporphyrinogen-3 oxidase